MLYDMHCHLDFFADPARLAAHLSAKQIGGLSVTVQPCDYVSAHHALATSKSFRVAAGLHPWWIAADEARAQAQVGELLDLLPMTSYVGEIGMDFSKHTQASPEIQVMVFRRIVRECARLGGKVLSLHGVKSASVMLDELESAGALRNNTCIFHWFSGSSQDLMRARELGCKFSIGMRMLQSAKGREYVKALPLDALLLETDLPQQGDKREAACVAQDMQQSLKAALGHLLHVKHARDASYTTGEEQDEMLADAIAQQSAKLLV